MLHSPLRYRGCCSLINNRSRMKVISYDNSLLKSVVVAASATMILPQNRIFSSSLLLSESSSSLPRNRLHVGCSAFLSSLRQLQQQQQRSLSSSSSSTTTRLDVYFRANEGLIEEEEFYQSSGATSSFDDDTTGTTTATTRNSDEKINGSSSLTKTQQEEKSINNQQQSQQRLSIYQAKALKELVSSFPYAYENTEDYQDLNVEQLHAMQQLISSLTTSSDDDAFTFTVDNDEEDESKASPSTISTNGDNDDGSSAMKLSPLQQKALDLIKDGKNVFVTGVAGTGKSLVLRKVLEYFQDNCYGQKNTFVAVAPTGPTALALGGQTIHSFAGIGIPKAQDSFSKTRTNKENAKRWKSLKTLILDECSMISGEFLDRLSYEVSLIREDPRPFGGIQLVLCGDFLQLPPIKPSAQNVQQERTAMEANGKDPNDLFCNEGYCFQSHAWYKADFQVVELDVVFRQKNQDYVKMLQHVRNGQVTKQVQDFLKQCQRPLPPNEYGIRPTMLHSRNRDVSHENNLELQKLPGESVIYEAKDTVEPEKGTGPWVKKQLKNNPFFRTCIAESELELKIGAEVMLVKNLPASRLYNGSRGKVENFRSLPKSMMNDSSDDPKAKYPVVQFVNGVRKVMTPESFESRLLGVGKCQRRAIPLKLAWAITTHKAQGLTLDYVIADVGGVFGEAQTYVALSRATDQNGLELRNFAPSKVRSNPIAIDFHQNPTKIQSFRAWDGTKIGSNDSNSGGFLQQHSFQEKKRLNDIDHDGDDDDDIGRSIEAMIFAKKFTVAELKEILKGMGLKTTGRKPDLVKRLLKAGVSPLEL